MVQTATRQETFRSGDLRLEGVLHLPEATPAAGVVVCHPHPQYGGDMDNNVVLAICSALVEHGIAALRFNFRGAGGSDGAFDQGVGERDDVLAALRHLASMDEIDGARIGLAGYSFGAIVAAEAASNALCGLALVSPPIAFGDLRVQWGCPAFVAGGNMDNLAPEDRLRIVADAPDVELHIVPGADHFWWGAEDEMSEMVAMFFDARLR